MDERAYGLPHDIYNLAKENQTLSGRIRILEEQHDIMHNFLVEINRYLANLTEKDNGLRKHEAKTQSKKANERGDNKRKAHKAKGHASS